MNQVDIFRDKQRETERIWDWKQKKEKLRRIWDWIIGKHNNHSIFSNPDEENISTCPNSMFYTPPKFMVAATFK